MLYRLLSRTVILAATAYYAAMGGHLVNQLLNSVASGFAKAIAENVGR